MFHRLSQTCSRLTEFRWNADNAPTDDTFTTREYLPSEANSLSWLSIPTPESALNCVAGACGKMLSPLSPIAQLVGDVLCDDIEQVISVLSGSELQGNPSSDVDDTDDDIFLIPFPPSPDDEPASTELNSSSSTGTSSSSTALPPPPRPIPQRTISGSPTSPSDAPVVPLPGPIPRIVITPAPLQDPSSSSSTSRVPVQDTSFGARLIVPSHSALNASHPPLVEPFFSSAPLHYSVRAWTYRWGHWCAVAHALDEQERRGIFSRPMNVRRRAVRKRGLKKREPPTAYTHSPTHTSQTQRVKA